MTRKMMTLVVVVAAASLVGGCVSGEKNPDGTSHWRFFGPAGTFNHEIGALGERTSVGGGGAVYASGRYYRPAYYYDPDPPIWRGGRYRSYGRYWDDGRDVVVRRCDVDLHLHSHRGHTPTRSAHSVNRRSGGSSSRGDGKHRVSRGGGNRR